MKIGGYKNIALMEDVELTKRIRKRGDKIRIIRKRVITSARRWETDGVIYSVIRNFILQGLFFLGVNPDKLARFYKLHCKET